MTGVVTLDAVELGDQAQVRWIDGRSQRGGRTERSHVRDEQEALRGA